MLLPSAVTAPSNALDTRDAGILENREPQRRSRGDGYGDRVRAGCRCSRRNRCAPVWSVPLVNRRGLTVSVSPTRIGDRESQTRTTAGPDGTTAMKLPAPLFAVNASDDDEAVPPTPRSVAEPG